MKASFFILSFFVLFISCKKKTDPVPQTNNPSSGTTNYIRLTFDAIDINDGGTLFGGLLAPSMTDSYFPRYQYVGYMIERNGGESSSDAIEIQLPIDSSKFKLSSYTFPAKFLIDFGTDTSVFNMHFTFQDNRGIVMKNINETSTLNYYNEVTSVVYKGNNGTHALYEVTGNFKLRVSDDGTTSSTIKTINDGSYKFILTLNRI
jgi:hypothetical protein